LLSVEVLLGDAGAGRLMSFSFALLVLVSSGATGAYWTLCSTLGTLLLPLEYSEVQVWPRRRTQK
jgi:hypothetical protein